MCAGVFLGPSSTLQAKHLHVAAESISHAEASTGSIIAHHESKHTCTCTCMHTYIHFYTLKFVFVRFGACKHDCFSFMLAPPVL